MPEYDPGLDAHAVDKTDGRFGSLARAGLVTLLGFLVFGWQVGRAGLWRDEAATIVACRRSLTDVLDLTRNLDLVHLAYYLLARLAWQLGGSVTAVRLISVIAMSLTAGMLVQIGRRLGSVWLGVLAGLLLVVNPFATRYAQEARPFAVVALLATISTYLLLRLCEPAPAPWVPPAYATGLVFLGLFNVLALMLVLVHACYVQIVEPTARRRWLLAATAGVAVIAPFVLVTSTQRGQVSWIVAPRFFDLRALLTAEFGSRIAPLLIGAVVLVVVLTQAVLRTTPAPPNLAALVLGGAWAVLPPVLLWSVSQVIPMWDAHYLLFSLPGLALLLAGLTPEVDRLRFTPRLAAAIVVPVVLLAALGIHDQRAYRDPVSGHSENLENIADYLYANAEVGDAVLFVPSELRVISEVYPTAFNGLDDVALDQTPLEAANLVGTPIEAAQLPIRLQPHQRVWLIKGLYQLPVTAGDLDSQTLDLLSKRYQAGQSQTVTDISISRYDAR
jgi:mannosyltransferase